VSGADGAHGAAGAAAASGRSADWADSGYAASWNAADGLAGLLRLPWQMTGAIVGQDRVPRLVMDLGSGPGTFLKVLLDRFPEARGVWVDSSPAMRQQATDVLRPVADRVSFVVGDVSDLAGLDVPHDCDVITNSRVAHHFDPAGLVRFYRQAAERLAAGGWVATLDHVLPGGTWDARLRAVLPEFAGPNAGKPTHPHYFPYPSVDDHLRSMADAGLDEVQMPWRAFYTCLFLGRRAPTTGG
jgi:SAM-dependent methyltransferase